jgi:hypothetical protein
VIDFWVAFSDVILWCADSSENVGPATVGRSDLPGDPDLLMEAQNESRGDDTHC